VDDAASFGFQLVCAVLDIHHVKGRDVGHASRKDRLRAVFHRWNEYESAVMATLWRRARRVDRGARMTVSSRRRAGAEFGYDGATP
jgi:galactokinase